MCVPAWSNALNVARLFPLAAARRNIDQAIAPAASLAISLAVAWRNSRKRASLLNHLSVLLAPFSADCSARKAPRQTTTTTMRTTTIHGARVHQAEAAPARHTHDQSTAHVAGRLALDDHPVVTDTENAGNARDQPRAPHVTMNHVTARVALHRAGELHAAPMTMNRARFHPTPAAIDGTTNHAIFQHSAVAPDATAIALLKTAWR